MQKVRRLYEQFQPSHYTLEFEIYQNSPSFSSRSRITGVQKNPHEIRLHVHDLTVDEVFVNDAPQTWHIEDDELVIERDGSGDVTISVTAQATITDMMHGVYPCYYDQDGERKKLFATQFESHYAREAFACVDEPEAKATYDISVTTDSGQIVLSNMPVSQQRISGSSTTTSFETTPRMSTYLVAFVVGDLQHASAQTKSGVTVNIYATPIHSQSSLEFALDQATGTIEYFDDYFGIPYPLPKSDHVALPDFASGAMENWGLITYREVALLADPDIAAIDSKQYIATVIAHELSHQWFGNLVTMKWWNNLWLNESFASLMEYTAPDHLHPDWHVWHDFITNESAVALRRDAIDGVQSVQTEVHHPDEITSLFDGAIVYAKGGCLLRMLSHFIGEKAFRAGLAAYFQQHAYSNTDEGDLWDAFADASHHDIRGFMTVWISQPGFPVVTATETTNGYHLAQEQFFIGRCQPANRLWPIPLDASIDSFPALFDTKEIDIAAKHHEFLLLNQRATGHFIVNYDTSLRQRVLGAIRADELTIEQRARFIQEQVILARAELLPPAELIDVIDAYEHESSECVWECLASAVNELKKYVESDITAEQKLRNLVGHISRQQYERLGWDAMDKEPINDTKLRTRIIANMLYSEDQDIIDTALRRFASADIMSLDSELRSLLISAAVRYGNDPDIIDRLIKQYVATPSAELRADIRSALTSTRDTGVSARLVSLLTDTHTIRPQDTTHWVIYLLSSRECRDVTWQWIREKWSWIEQTFASDKSYDYFPRYAGQLLMTRQQLDEYQKFFQPMRDNIALTRAIDMGITDLRGRVELIERQSSEVCKRLLEL